MSPTTRHTLTLELSRAEKAGDPYAFSPVRQEYRRREEDGTYRSATFPWSVQMERDLAALEVPEPDRACVQRLGDALRTFLLDLGWERDELHLRQALEAGHPVHLTCRFAAAELYALPWELVTLSPTRQHLGELPGCIVQYEWPGSRTAPPPVSPAPEGGRLLFACSADVPADLHLLAMRQACARNRYPFDPERDYLAHVSLAGLAEALSASPEPIAALHILCHGARTVSGTQGLIWHPSGPLGQMEILDAGALRQALGAHAGRIRMVVLCACSGADPGPLGNQLGSVAQALHQIGIPAVVASRFPISRHGSVRLTEALYGELLGGPSSLQDALGAARKRLAQGPGSLDGTSLRLYARAGEGPDLRPFILRPYRGLLPFEPHHRRFFFGREALQQAVLDRIQEAPRRARPRFQVVAGASGSGKSSLVMAGVVPALDQGSWEFRIIRPHDDVALEEARRWNVPGRHLLVVVDQLEEAFTQIRDPAMRQGFFHALWELAGRPEPSVVVIATLRVDHFERCGEIRLDEAGRRLDAIVYSEAHRIFVPRMEPEQQEAAILGPARAVGLELEQGLVERLRKDVGQEPGALPLLEHALDLLWQRREGNRMTHRAYEAMGGVAGALTRTVEGLYKDFSPKQRLRLRRLMVELVDLRDAAAPATRRRVWRDQVRPAHRAARTTFDSVVEALVDKRLLIRGGETEASGAPVWVEIAHEALIRQWKRLQRWIREDREQSSQLRELNAWAEAWAAHRGDADGGASYLLSGDRLGYARRLEEQYRGDLSLESTRFIRASWERSEAERARERQARRRLQYLIAGLAALLALATGLGALAYQQWDLAGKRAADATLSAMQSKAQAVLADGDPGVAALLLLEMGGPARDREWMALAQRVLQKNITTAALRHPAPVRAAAFSPDGSRIVTAGSDGIVRVWSADGRGGPVTLRGHRDLVEEAAFSPDGSRVVSASNDGTARVWSADGRGETVVLVGHRDAIASAVFSPDGRRVLTASKDGTARVWSVDGKERPVVLDHGAELRSARFSLDGRQVMTAGLDRLAKIWSSDGTGLPVILSGHKETVGLAIFSPDGRLVLTASGDRTARIWTVEGALVAVLAGHQRSVFSAAFAPDGKHVATSSLDGTARVWGVDGTPGPVLQHQNQVWRVAFSPDSRRVVTASSDLTVRVWRAEDGKELLRLKGHEGEVWRAAFSPRGDRVVSVSSDRTARVWKVDREGEQVVLGDARSSISSAAFSAGGEHVLTTSTDGAARVWKAGGGEEPLVLKAGGAVTSAAFSPDGSQVLTASRDGVARLWNATHQDELRTFSGNRRPLSSASFSPDSARIVTTSEDGTARIWNVDGTGEAIVLGGHQERCRLAAFSPDGKQVVTASDDGTARLWTIDGLLKFMVLGGHDGPVTRAAFSPDGDRVVTASEAGTVRIWRTDRVEDPVVVSKHAKERNVSVAFSPDGERIVTASFAGTARVWSTDGQEVLSLPHGAGVTSAVFSPDGRWVLTASLDLTAKLWWSDRYAEPLELKGHTGWVTSASFSPDSRWAVTTSRDGTARVWALSVPLLQEQLRNASVTCLSIEHRKAYLDESESVAGKKYEDCERSYGRLP